MIARLQGWLSGGAGQGALMAAAMVIAGGFDALVSIVSGRLLVKEQFAIFVAVTALIQIWVNVTNVIRNVVAYYTAEFTVAPDALSRVQTFFRRGWYWSWRWGLIATATMLLLSPFVARFMRIDSAWPLWAASLSLLMLFVRPVTDGTLQGVQNFIGLSAVQVSQSFLRLALAVLLILAGLQAVGAIIALPLATTAALGLAVAFLRPYFRPPQIPVSVPAISLRYSLYTFVGLAAYALLINVDALAVKRFFSDTVAGDYGTVVTLGKINLFATLGIGLVLFPKATQRQAAGQDPRPVLALALAATFAVGTVVTCIYFLASGPLVNFVFSTAYSDPGLVLGLVGIATTLYAGINIWLNYALSLRRPAFIVALAALVVLVVAAMSLYHETLVTIAAIMIGAGLLGNLAGIVTALPQPRLASPEQGPPI